MKPQLAPKVVPQPQIGGVDRSATVRAPRVPELMAADIRRRILRHELTDGDTLPPEAELIRQYGISRPTLREALRILEAESLIVIRRGGLGGAIVQRPRLSATSDHFGILLQDRGATVSDVHWARMAIEPPTLAHFALVGSKTQFQILQERLEVAKGSIGSTVDFTRALIADFTGQVTSALLMQLLRRVIESHAEKVSETRSDDWTALQRRSYRSHAKLIALLETGNVDEAERFWRGHLGEVGKILLHDAAQIQVIDLLS
jgi:DNA-binding FadR family transcriptional regulator